MALTNRQRVDDALMLLKEGLSRCLEQIVTAKFNAQAWTYAVEGSDRFNTKSDNLDLTRLFGIFHEYRRDVTDVLGRPAVNLIHEAQELRNKHAHQEPWTTEDALRALDTSRRLLEVMQQPAAAEQVRTSYEQLMRSFYAEQTRNETKKAVRAINTQSDAALSSWREVVMPHDDVRTGNFKEAEFAADLDQVHQGKAGPEYQDPKEFFSRTYLTEGLTNLLRNGLQRLTGTGGDPVIELQTNFGGGKTHSMIALYHAASGIPLTSIPSLEPMADELGLTDPVVVQRAVLVGTKLSPNEPRRKADGITVHTFWGELAWQLAGEPGYRLVENSDRTGLPPGAQVLQQVFDIAGPSLILIDEWVAFVRHLYFVGDQLPAAGSFEANLTFAQNLTEAVTNTPGVILAASLPSSEIEVGGEGGQRALERLRHTFGRVKSTWRAAETNESFEIVRRRLFQDIADPRKRDGTIAMYMKLYEQGGQQFPNKVAQTTYRSRMEAAYPFHPELFDMLFDVWGSLDSFQRTRGVLRLMANVVHALWERNDPSPLIMPANVPLDDSRIVTQMAGYLPESWSAVIESDIDGEHATSLMLDRANPNLDKMSATRRVARSIFLGTAPTMRSENRGIDDRTIRLAVAQPGEQISIFGDALRALADRATYLYNAQGRYWFSTQASVTRTAQERLSVLPVEDKDHKIIESLREHQAKRGIFDRVHIANNGSGEIADTPDVTLVIFGPNYPHVRNQNGQGGGVASDAIRAAANILDTRGDHKRTHRNGLIFLAPDKSRLEDVRKAAAEVLVWSRIVDEKDLLNLDSQQFNQAKSRKDEAERALRARLPEAWSWLLVPHANMAPGSRVEWETWSLKSGRDEEQLPVAAGKRAEYDETVITAYDPRMLRSTIDEIMQSRGGWTHIRLDDLSNWFANYLYMPRLRNEEVLHAAIRKVHPSLFEDQTPFFLASGFDEATGHYTGITTGSEFTGPLTASTLLVHPDEIVRQRRAEADEAAARQAASDEPTFIGFGQEDDRSPGYSSVKGVAGIYATPMTGSNSPTDAAPPVVKRRFYGSVKLNPQMMQSQVGEISRELMQHLQAIYGAKVKIHLEIEVESEDGFPEQTQQQVSKAADELRFEQHEFVEE